jgi:hypothetical protein
MVALLIAAAGPVLADETSSVSEREVRPAHSVAFGVGTGAAGFLVGFLVGSSDDGDGEGLDDLANGIIIGSAVGALTLPLGVHAGNESQGNLGLVMLTSVLAGGAGWGLAAVLDDPHVVLVTPVLQIVSSVAVEIATTPRRSPSNEPSSDDEVGPHDRDWDMRASVGVIDRQPALLIGGRF